MAQIYQLDLRFNILFIEDGVGGQSVGFTSWDSTLGLANVIRWDPTTAIIVRQADGTYGALSPAVALFHEIEHGLTAATGKYDEYLVTLKEQQLAAQLGEPARISYGATSGSILVYLNL